MFECFCFCIVGRDGQSETRTDIVGSCKVCGGRRSFQLTTGSVASSQWRSPGRKRTFSVFLGHRQALEDKKNETFSDGTGLERSQQTPRPEVVLIQ